MSFFRGWWLPNQLLGVLAGFITLLFLGASSARGECGHYVLVGVQLGQHHQLPSQGLIPQTPNSPTKSQCESGPRPIPMVPPAPASVVVNQWSILTDLVVSLSYEAASFPVRNTRFHPIHQPLFIFHPPR